LLVPLPPYFITTVLESYQLKFNDRVTTKLYNYTPFSLLVSHKQNFTMASDLCTRRLTKELRALQKDPIKTPKITIVPNEANILEMHYVIEGSDKTPYTGGIYHGKLIFPKDYPLKPPSVMMLTPSGRFQPSRRLCLSMSDFHPETWNPMWSVSTILTGLYSFMLETAPTLGSIETTTSQKQKYARQSLDFNCKDGTFRRLFPEYLELHKERLMARQKALGITEPPTPLSYEPAGQILANDRGDMNGIFTTAAGVVALLSAVLFAMRFL
jgi:ubiquitin-conjugating enzyme E2 J2